MTDGMCDHAIMSTSAPIPNQPNSEPKLNDGRGVPSKGKIQETLLDTVSASYRPSLPIHGWTYDFWPTYQFWFDIEDMLQHSAVFTPLMFTQSPIMVCEHDITASDKTVEAYARSQRDRFWDYCVRAVLDGGHPYGWMGGEVIYSHVGKYLSLEKLKGFAPRDVVPLSLDGELVGIEVRNMHAEVSKLWLGADKVPAKGFWYAHRPRFGYVYGRSILRPAWRDWKRLAGRDGLEETTDVGAYRYALGFTIIRYPNEKVNNDQGQSIPARDVAREMGESLRAGASVQLSSTHYRQGEGEGPKWDLEFKTPELSLGELGDFGDRLRKQIAGSIGCPPELMEASETGSGFSGRMIPMMAFLMSRQAEANEITQVFEDKILKPLVFWNFGPKAWVRVKVKPLLQTFNKLFAAPNQSSQGIADPSGQMVGKMPPLSGVRDLGAPEDPNAKFNVKSPTPEQVMAAITVAQQEAVAHGNPHANDEEIEILKSLLEGGGKPKGDDGFVGTVSRAKHLKAVGVGKNAGQNMYDKDALRVLKAQDEERGIKHALGDSLYKFASTQVNLTGQAMRMVLHAGHAIDPDDLAEDGLEVEPHVTVLYGLHDNDPSDAMRVVSQFPSLDFAIGKPMVFEKGDCDVLVYAIEPSSGNASRNLWAMHEQLRLLPNSNKYPDYKPHATIAYLKPGCGKKYVDLVVRTESPLPVSATEVIFSAKDGTRYALPLHDGGTMVRVALGWSAEPTRTGGTKAVGTGEHAGQVLYGEDARRVLQGGTPSASPDEEGGRRSPGGDDDGGKPAFEEGKKNAYHVLAKLHAGEQLDEKDIAAFAESTKSMSAAELQAVNNLLIAKLGGKQRHDAIVNGLRNEAKKQAGATPPPLPKRGSKSGGDPFAEYEPTGEGVNTIPKPKAPAATPTPPPLPAKPKDVRPASEQAEERYQRLRMGDYRNAGHKHDADIADATSAKADGIRRSPSGDWHVRAGSGYDAKKPPTHRASLNVRADKTLIAKLDEFAKKHGVAFKTPSSADEWHTRHDPVTIYGQKEFTPEQQAELAKIVAPYARGDEGLTGKKIGKGVSISKEPTADDAKKLMERIKAKNPEAAASLAEWTGGKTPSVGMMHVMEQMANEYDGVDEGEPNRSTPVKPSGEQPRLGRGELPSAETFQSFKEAPESHHAFLRRTHEAHKNKSAEELHDNAMRFDKAHDRSNYRDVATSNFLWEMYGHARRNEGVRATSTKVSPNPQEQVSPAPTPQNTRTNDLLDEAFASPVEASPTPAPKKDMRENSDLDEAFGEPAMFPTKNVQPYEIPKPQEQAIPTPSEETPVANEEPKPQEQQQTAPDVHPDLAALESFKNADPKYHGHLQDAYQRYSGRSQAELDGDRTNLRTLASQTPAGEHRNRLLREAALVGDLKQKKEQDEQAKQAERASHPDLVSLESYQQADETSKRHLQDLFHYHKADSAAQLKRRAHKANQAAARAITNDEQKYYEQQVKMLREMHGRKQMEEDAAKQAERDAKKQAAQAAKESAKPESQEPVVEAAPTVKKPKKIHPELAAMKAFRDAPEQYQESLRDVHASNIGRSSGALFRSLQRQNLAADRAEENGDPNTEQYRHHANLLKEMHERALQAEEKKNDANSQQRKLEFMRNNEPKVDRRNKLRYIVRKYGGINPKNYQKHFGNVKEDLKENGLQSLIRHNGQNLDELVTELEGAGYFHTPPDRHASDYLIELLQNDADHDQADGRSKDHEYEYGYHQMMMNEMEREQAELEQERENARDADESESSIAKAIREGQSAGEEEAYAALPPEAQEDRDEANEWDGRDDGEWDSGGDEWDRGEDDPSPDVGGNDFPFGANASDDDTSERDDEPTDDDRQFAPDVPGVNIDSQEDNSVEQPEEQAASPEATSAPTSEAREAVDGPPTAQDAQEVTDASPEETEAYRPEQEANEQGDEVVDAAPPDASRKWKKNEDGTYTAPNGTVWKKAAIGGEESPVNGKRYAGGALMPIHGKSKPSDSEVIGGDGGASVGQGGEMEKKPRGERKGPQKRGNKARDKNDRLVDIPDDHIALESLVAGSPWKADKLNDDALRYLGIDREAANAIKDAAENGVLSIPRSAIPNGRRDKESLLQALEQAKKPTEASVKAFDPIRVPVNDPMLDAPLANPVYKFKELGSIDHPRMDELMDARSAAQEAHKVHAKAVGDFVANPNDSSLRDAAMKARDDRQEAENKVKEIHDAIESDINKDGYTTKKELASDTPKKPASAIVAVPSFRDWRWNKIATNSGMIVPNRPGVKFTDEQIAGLKEWAKSQGLSIQGGPTGLRVTTDSGKSLDLLQHSAVGAKKEKEQARKDAEQAAAKQAAAAKQDEANSRESSSWIEDTFGKGTMNAHNMIALANFLEGKSKKFDGLHNSSWLDGAIKTGAVRPDGTLDFEAVKRSYQQHIGAKGKPTEVLADYPDLAERFKANANPQEAAPTPTAEPQADAGKADATATGATKEAGAKGEQVGSNPSSPFRIEKDDGDVRGVLTMPDGQEIKGKWRSGDAGYTDDELRDKMIRDHFGRLSLEHQQTKHASVDESRAHGEQIEKQKQDFLDRLTGGNASKVVAEFEQASGHTRQYRIVPKMGDKGIEYHAVYDVKDKGEHGTPISNSPGHKSYEDAAKHLGEQEQEEENRRKADEEYQRQNAAKTEFESRVKGKIKTTKGKMVVAGEETEGMDHGPFFIMKHPTKSEYRVYHKASGLSLGDNAMSKNDALHLAHLTSLNGDWSFSNRRDATPETLAHGMRVKRAVDSGDHAEKLAILEGSAPTKSEAPSPQPAPKKSPAKPKPVAVPDHAKDHAADWQQAAANLRAQGKRAVGRALADEFKRIRAEKDGDDPPVVGESWRDRPKSDKNDAEAQKAYQAAVKNKAALEKKGKLAADRLHSYTSRGLPAPDDVRLAYDQYMQEHRANEDLMHDLRVYRSKENDES